MSISQLMQDYFIKGALDVGGSWGGPLCAAAVNISTHLQETIGWIIIASILWTIFDLETEYKKLWNMSTNYYRKNKSNTITWWRMCEIFLGLVEATIFLRVVYYKYNKMSICYLLQPCHIVLFLQSYSLLVSTPFESVVASLSISMVTGTGMAMLFPDTSGLDQPYEETLYWVQHVIIQVVPFIILLRNDNLVYRMTSLKTLWLANWGVLVLHWTMYEV